MPSGRSVPCSYGVFATEQQGRYRYRVHKIDRFKTALFPPSFRMIEDRVRSRSGSAWRPRTYPNLPSYDRSGTKVDPHGGHDNVLHVLEYREQDNYRVLRIG